MKLNPITKELYTDKDELIKRLSCPYKMTWDDLEETLLPFKKCSKCKQIIVDTEYLSDDELSRIINQNPSTCLKVNLNQHNIKLITNGILDQK